MQPNPSRPKETSDVNQNVDKHAAGVSRHQPGVMDNKAYGWSSPDEEFADSGRASRVDGSATSISLMGNKSARQRASEHPYQ